MALFRDLLSSARYNLFRSQQGTLSDTANITGIEESLAGEYFDQIVRLNNYVYTTGSTNNPGTGFQSFWIDLFAPAEVCELIISNLSPTEYSYSYQRASSLVLTDEGEELARHLVREDDGSHLFGLKTGFADSYLADQLPDSIREQYSDLIPSLFFLTIDDAISTRDTLYQTLLDILEYE